MARMFLTCITAVLFPVMMLAEVEQSNDDCITFASDDVFTLSMEKGWNGTLYYSTNKNTWVVWEGETIAASQIDNAGPYYLHIRGDTNNSRINSTMNLTGTSITCSGNLETLRGAIGDKPSVTPMASYCYRSLFYGCTGLISAPALPVTTLTHHCYYHMFSGCSSLVNAPALPATTLAINCYAYMFYGCSSLVNAPALPATTLAESCYYYMFYGCSSLVNAPALPATTLANCCYFFMFYGCSSLTNAPALPATTLADFCYSRMFYNCSSLVTAPELPATTVADKCYQSMFAGCTSIMLNESAPGRKWMIPENTTGAGQWKEGMFKGTGGDFTGNPEIGKVYYIASDCNREIDLGGGMTARDYYNGDYAISGEGELTAAQAAMLKNEGVTNLWIDTDSIGENVFEGWLSLAEVNLGTNCTSVGTRAFHKCYGLTNVTSTATEAVALGDHAFLRCNSLETMNFATTPTFGCDAFKIQAAIRMNGDVPEVYSIPAISVGENAKRVMGKKDLADENWTDVTNMKADEKRLYHFFQIVVQ